MEDKLITLVTLTYAKAEILKSVLESEGIMSELYNVNVIQPFVSSGVKVRINEKDLQRALEIVESGSWLKEDGDEPEKKNILVPVDFSDQSILACYLLLTMHLQLALKLFCCMFSSRRFIRQCFRLRMKSIQLKSTEW